MQPPVQLADGQMGASRALNFSANNMQPNRPATPSTHGAARGYRRDNFLLAVAGDVGEDPVATVVVDGIPCEKGGVCSAGALAHGQHFAPACNRSAMAIFA